MKKILSIVAALTLITSFAVMAQDNFDSNYYDQEENIGKGDVRVTSDKDTGRAVWATVYAGSNVYDAKCVLPGESVLLRVNPSSMRINYYLQAEYKENMDCRSNNIKVDKSGTAHISDSGIEGFLNKDHIVSFH